MAQCSACSLKITLQCFADCIKAVDDSLNQLINQLDGGVDHGCNCAQANLDHIKQRRPILLGVKQIAEHLDDRLQRRQQRIGQFQPKALCLNAELGDRVVEQIRARGKVLAHLVGELLHAGCAFVQQRDQIRAGFAKQRNRRGRLLRAVGHVRETIGNLLQCLVGRHHLAVGPFDIYAKPLESAGQIIIALGGLDQIHAQFGEALGERALIHIGQLGSVAQSDQCACRNAGFGLQVEQLIASVNGSLYDRA